VASKRKADTAEATKKKMEALKRSGEDLQAQCSALTDDLPKVRTQLTAKSKLRKYVREKNEKILAEVDQY